MNIFMIFIAAALVGNYVLTKFLGLCPFVGVSRRLSSALGMGIAVIFVMSIASALTWCINHFLLIPLKIEYLQTIFFILVIASCVQFIEMVIQKFSPSLYHALGIYLPLITTNCAILGVTIINVREAFNFLQSICNAVGAGFGFTLALLLMAAIRERLDIQDVPKPFKGIPITFLCASLMSLAFMGFVGLVK